MKPDSNKREEELWLEALRLLESPAGDGRTAVDDFRAQSQIHRQVLLRAERYLTASRQMPRQRPSAWRKTKLTAQLWLARSGQAPIASAAIALLVFGIGWMLFPVPPSEVSPPAPTIAQDSFDQSYETAWGERKEITLPDGSTLWLDWGADVSVRLSETTRTVTVNAGTVAFAVTSDPDAPFTVSADDVRVRVTGTEFTVARDRRDRVAVDVMEGTVSVSLGEDHSTLAAAQRVVAERGQLLPLEYRETEEMGRWREGVLVFRERPLVESIDALSAYLPYEVDTRSIAFSGRRVTGVYLIEEAEQGLKAIIGSHGLEAEAQGSVLELRERRLVRP
ncbi:MAG: FecR domain-containing protein [Pseudomonadota bacterium]